MCIRDRAYPDYLSKDYPLWPQIQQRDTLLFYPYQSMQPFLGLLREAANDPQVLSIQMTIYRLAGNSAVAKHLCTAAENGKSVTVLVQLRACLLYTSRRAPMRNLLPFSGIFWKRFHPAAAARD